MGALSSILRSTAGGRVSFFCPGCREAHAIRISGGERPTWTWNGDAELPTFSPSILVRSGHFVPGFDPAVDTCWCTYNREHPDEPVSFACSVCHSYVTDGKIQFLGDCTHHLAGQTVPLPPWEPD